MAKNSTKKISKATGTFSFASKYLLMVFSVVFYTAGDDSFSVWHFK